MHFHRSPHGSGFTVLPNALLQNRRLSYTARGLLADLLSRPDGWSEDGRIMADTSTQGRRAVARALRELADFGYYRVVKVRHSDGTLTSEAHVYDTPQTAPDLTRPGPGEPCTDGADAQPPKKREKEPTLPRQRPAPAEETADAAGTDREGGRPPSPDVTPEPERDDGPPGEPVATLFRVLSKEPRLRVGVAEAAALAPLVSAWLERGYDERDLAGALLGGLPARVHCAPALLRNRLTRKLPPPREPSAPSGPRWTECGECGRPISHRGICGPCAGLGDDGPGDGGHRARIVARGRARVRAALAAGPLGPVAAGGA